MSRRIEEALADCLERVVADGATPEEALSRYPELRAELEPLLTLSAELGSLPKVEAPASLRGYKRPVFRTAPAQPAKAAWWRRLLPAPGPSFGWAAPLARVAIALGVFVAASGGAVVASANSLPDEPLYSVKLAVESAELALAPNERARAAVELKHAAKRLEEVEVAAEQGRPEAVTKGAELYRERADAAVKAAKDSGSDTAAVEESVRQNEEALERVVDKLAGRSNDNATAHSQAVAAIQRILDGENGQKDTSGEKGKPEKGSPAAAVVASPTATATATATAAATATATPTATPEPTKTHEPPGKATGRPDQPGNSGQPGGQGAVPAEKAQGAVTKEPEVGPSATATPTVAATQAGGRGQGADKPGNDPQPRGNAEGKEKKGSASQEDENLLSNILHSLQNLMTKR